VLRPLCILQQWVKRVLYLLTLLLIGRFPLFVAPGEVRKAALLACEHTLHPVQTHTNHQVVSAVHIAAHHNLNAFPLLANLSTTTVPVKLRRLGLHSMSAV